MKLENSGSKQFHPYGNSAIFGVPLDDNTLDKICAGDKDAVKVLLAPVAKAIDDFFNLFKG